MRLELLLNYHRSVVRADEERLRMAILEYEQSCLEERDCKAA